MPVDAVSPQFEQIMMAQIFWHNIKTPPAGCFREEVKNVKNMVFEPCLMPDVGGPPMPRRPNPGT